MSTGSTNRAASTGRINCSLPNLVAPSAVSRPTYSEYIWHEDSHGSSEEVTEQEVTRD